MTATSGVPFEAGQPVIVGVGPMHERRWHRTSIRRVDARIVWLDGVAEDESVVDVQPGEEITCHSWRAMDALYQTTGRVAFTRLAPEPLVGMTVQSVERIQQREYVRVPLSTHATALYVGAATPAELAEPTTLELTVHDLSAGGLRGHCNTPLHPGDELTIELPLPHAQPDMFVPVHLRGRVVTLPNLPAPLNLRARVVRLIDTNQNPDLSHDIGIAFVDVSKETRERIIRFALDIQRERRRRGMM